MKRLNFIFNLCSDAPNYDGRTALHIAVAENQEEIVRYLISQGSNPRLEDKLGRTAFTELPSQDSSLHELLEWGETLQSETLHSIIEE